MYIPLGGKNNTIRNSLLVFTFVALWHDISLDLFAWAIMIVVFNLPEIFCLRLVRKSGLDKAKNYIYFAALGSMCNIVLMIIGNLVGFAFGLSGIKIVLEKCLHLQGKHDRNV
jgi:D-alanyl-lipoteichoic acid acyltransferase DltB (MBOAT superfamily)